MAFHLQNENLRHQQPLVRLDSLALHEERHAKNVLLVRAWLTRIPGCESLILVTMRKEMNIETQDALRSDFDSLCSFQAYLIYSMTIHLFPQTAFRSARAGLTCRAEESHTRPTWESWIVACAKRRTLFTMYLFKNVYNTQVGLPNFVAEERRVTLAPGSKMLWEASDRAVWEREYNRHLSRWEDGMLEISELWRSAETGTEARREKIERWLQSADEFGMMFFISVCAYPWVLVSSSPSLIQEKANTEQGYKLL
ncbi:hypothetical protein N7519_002917 [Penicillium mononematosum]|uniref:uncharacterized protein n=1 Tax=Penicillium mononematosum TaxID=268346 RepID=UPI0025465BD9|nr:uncharacterized protein N7519_002917 [Penicillium mononematosum]KAJ6188009.1 hypothetical protein N7519_002917 [Penicillium mononematosum]